MGAGIYPIVALQGLKKNQPGTRCFEKGEGGGGPRMMLIGGVQRRHNEKAFRDGHGVEPLML